MGRLRNEGMVYMPVLALVQHKGNKTTHRKGWATQPHPEIVGLRIERILEEHKEEIPKDRDFYLVLYNRDYDPVWYESLDYYLNGGSFSEYWFAVDMAGGKDMERFAVNKTWLREIEAGG